MKKEDIHARIEAGNALHFAASATGGISPAGDVVRALLDAGLDPTVLDLEVRERATTTLARSHRGVVC